MLRDLSTEYLHQPARHLPTSVITWVEAPTAFVCTFRSDRDRISTFSPYFRRCFSPLFNMSQSWSLDLDTLGLVLGYVEEDKVVLLRMALLNKAVHSLTLPILYRSNTFKRVDVAYKFCQAVHNHPQYLGCFVQKLHLYNTYGAVRTLWSNAAIKFVQIIPIILPLLPNLRDLIISGVEFETNASSLPPFSLRSFSLMLPVATSPWEFLQNQMSLKQLELRPHPVRTRLRKNDCLSLDGMPHGTLFPDLNILSGCSEIFATLAPRRPITHAFISGCQMHRDAVYMPRMISAISLSTRPLQSLRIDLASLHNASCVEFVEHLASVGTALESLMLITTALDNSYWQSSVLADAHPTYPPSPPELFSRLKALRYLFIEKPTWQPSIVFDSEQSVYRFQPGPIFKSVWSQAEAADLWRTRCPGMVSVKIYGRKLKISHNSQRLIK
ncbi:unnamed protein product [Rhizoctonia solani]|uniref:Uncharacterized protein n=1 Tax=Rhizoctonia solani TaxID=456999 RepID=A0A8H2WSX7_9AGAM|nr:unnamed protein product [Rhizoctonia solani]